MRRLRGGERVISVGALAPNWTPPPPSPPSPRRPALQSSCRRPLQSSRPRWRVSCPMESAEERDRMIVNQWPTYATKVKTRRNNPSKIEKFPQVESPQKKPKVCLFERFLPCSGTWRGSALFIVSSQPSVSVSHVGERGFHLRGHESVMISSIWKEKSKDKLSPRMNPETPPQKDLVFFRLGLHIKARKTFNILLGKKKTQFQQSFDQ